MEEEVDSLPKNETWNLEFLPRGQNMVRKQMGLPSKSIDIQSY